LWRVTCLKVLAGTKLGNSLSGELLWNPRPNSLVCPPTAIKEVRSESHHLSIYVGVTNTIAFSPDVDYRYQLQNSGNLEVDVSGKISTWVILQLGVEPYSL
jgi:hypothetical protein